MGTIREEGHGSWLPEVTYGDVIDALVTNCYNSTTVQEHEELTFAFPTISFVYENGIGCQNEPPFVNRPSYAQVDSFNGVWEGRFYTLNADQARLALETEVTVRSNDKHVWVTYAPYTEDVFTHCSEIEIHHLRLEMMTQRIVNDEDNEDDEEENNDQWFEDQWRLVGESGESDGESE